MHPNHFNWIEKDNTKALVTVNETLATELLSHPLMVTIVFFDKCWGNGARYESRGARV